MTETLSPVGWAVSKFGFRSFVLVSDFVLRISDFDDTVRVGLSKDLSGPA
jgi:hypothetical protein